MQFNSRSNYWNLIANIIPMILLIIGLIIQPYFLVIEDNNVLFFIRLFFSICTLILTRYKYINLSREIFSVKIDNNQLILRVFPFGKKIILDRQQLTKMNHYTHTWVFGVKSYVDYNAKLIILKNGEEYKLIEYHFKNFKEVYHQLKRFETK